MDYGVENLVALEATRRIGDGDLTVMAAEVLARIAEDSESEKATAADLAKSKLASVLKERRPAVHAILTKCFAPFYGD